VKGTEETILFTIILQNVLFF